MLIGLVGFAGSGKGTVADILVEKHYYKKISFADSVKDATASIFGWQRFLLEGDTEESRLFRETVDDFWSSRFNGVVTPRKMLQMVGTEAGRDLFHKDLWLFSLEKKLQDYENVVIADVRFPNEVDFIRNKGGYVVRIKRGPEPEWYDTAMDISSKKEYNMSLTYPNVHISEWAWIGQNFDYVIHNEGSKNDLESNVEKILLDFRQRTVYNRL